jgi:putative IMPACT (imprinted ancient) family translation regulator
MKRILPAFSARIEEEQFAADALFHISLPEARAEAFVAALTEMTEGAVLVRTLG